jgi:hypothetical protein
MALIITPTTELEAVNEMLTAIGTVPVNTLNTVGLTDAAIAKDTLSSISREVQSRGWWFNTSKNVTLNPSGGIITLPTNVMHISPALPTVGQAGENSQFVVRNGRLFNITTHTDTSWTQSVRADIIYLFDFETVPEPARRYITVRAARVFQTKVLGDEQLGVFTESHELEAWSILEGSDITSGPSRIYEQRIRQRFASLRPDPVVGGRQKQQQG